MIFTKLFQFEDNKQVLVVRRTYTMANNQHILEITTNAPRRGMPAVWSIVKDFRNKATRDQLFDDFNEEKAKEFFNNPKLKL